MDGLLTEAMKQVPALGVLVYVVYVFVRHLGASRDAAYKILADSNQVTRENTKAIDELRLVLRAERRQRDERE